MISMFLPSQILLMDIGFRRLLYLQGYVRDMKSGALLRIPTEEETDLVKMKKLIREIYISLPKTSRDKIDPKLLEVIKDV